MTKLILLSIFIYSCFVPTKLFPLPACNATSKHILFVFDCHGEFQEQVHFMETTVNYFKTHTKVTFFTYYYKTSNNTIFSDKDRYINVNNGCNSSTDLPIDEVMQVSRQWQLKYIVYSCKFILNIIFIHNTTGDIEMFINKTIESEQRENIYISRFFIVKSSEFNRMRDFIYYIPSFQDLDINDIFRHICDLDPEENTLTNSDGKYVRSKYFIAKQLQSLDAKEVRCYCESRHGNNVISLETYNELLQICEHLLNLFANHSTRVINIHIGLKDLRWNAFKPFTFFMPPEFVDWTGCFYLKLSKSKDFRLFADEFYNLGSHLEKIDCDAKLSNALVVCEDYENLQSSLNWSTYQLGMTADNTWVVHSHFFINFMTEIFHQSNVNKLFSEITYGQCNKKRNSSRNVLETYLCGDLMYEVKNVKQTESKSYIYLLTNEHGYFYILNAVDISKCHNYNECQAKVENDSNSIDAVTMYCSDKSGPHKNCSAKVIKSHLDLQYSQCKTNNDQYFYKCIKDDSGHCSDNSNLLNCENFTCPKPFFKCPNSYCILYVIETDVSNECPMGDIDFPYLTLKYTAQLSFLLREICIDSVIFDDLFAFINDITFVCKHNCPLDHTCLSSRTKRNVENDTDSEIEILYFSINLTLSKESKSFYVNHDHYEFNEFVAFMSIVAFTGSQFEITDFDQGFQYWDFGELLILDLSYNNIMHSKYLKSIERFYKLKYLNISHNKNLEIDQNFTFPTLLEIIDLSCTKISALKSDAFYSLTNLRHLNLSYTLIKKFKDMGIPSYFKLDTLYIQDLSTEYLEKGFFRGLTIHLELRASDFLMCCPQVLNPNIDVEKCHYPFDIISSCKHLVGDTLKLKRIVIWIVGLLTLVGNGSVVVYRIVWNREIFKNAYGLFITGLAVSDLLMGIYLIILAIVDIYYTDEYVLKDFAWRNGFLCPILGIFSTLSSEASASFICLITLDRFFKITYPFGEHGFSKTGKLLSFILVWTVSFILALAPVVVPDREIYSSNGLCVALPFSSKQYKGWIFSFTVFVCLNFVLCLLIVFGQVVIFIKLIKTNQSNAMVKQSIQRSSQERTVARKLAFVAVTDYCCWFPVGILGLLSLFGHIFNREVYAWIAVFVLPVNSAVNPFIYTLPALYNFCKKYFLN